MKFLLGFITSTIIIAIMFIGCWLYFDFPISTNDEIQKEEQTQQIQQEQIQQENVQEQTYQTAPSQAPVSENVQEEKAPTEVDESQQRKAEIQALQENDKEQDWKEEYDEINEGTDEKPYVTIDGQKVDPKFLLEGK